MWKKKEDVIDDITCVVVFMDTKLIDRSLKYRDAEVQNLTQKQIESDQSQSIIQIPLNKYFSYFNDSYEEAADKKWQVQYMTQPFISKNKFHFII